MAADSGLAARAWLWATVMLTASAFGTAVVLAPPASASPIRGLSFLLFMGSSVHVASTGWFYTVPEVRRHALDHPARYVWLPVGLILLTAAAAALVSPARLRWLLLPYFCWQYFHFQKQNLGLTALAASSDGLQPLRPAERRPLLLTGAAGIAALMARPALLQLAVRSPVSAAFPVAVSTFAVAGGAGVWMLYRRPAGQRPAGFCVLYLLSLLFPLPVFVFGSPYAAVGGMTIAHGMQYLLLVGLVAAGSGHRPGRLISLAGLVNIAVGGGAALSSASHLHGSAPAVRLLFGAYLGAAMAHFVIDAGLWRLRDPFPRAFMATRVPYLVPSRPARASAPAPSGLPRSREQPVARQPT